MNGTTIDIGKMQKDVIKFIAECQKKKSEYEAEEARYKMEKAQIEMETAKLIQGNVLGKL